MKKKAFSTENLIISLLILFLLAFTLLAPKTCLAQSRNRRYSLEPYNDYVSFKKEYRDMHKQEGPFLRFSFGYGIPYGYFGINGEYMLSKYFSLTGGLGYSPGGSGWIMGARVYINEPSRRLRPRITVLYGTVSVLAKKYGPEEMYETDQGYAYGIGLDWKFLDSGKHSLDFDIVMTDYNVPPGYEKKGPKIKFSLGYGRVF